MSMISLIDMSSHESIEGKGIRRVSTRLEGTKVLVVESAVRTEVGA